MSGNMTSPGEISLLMFVQVAFWWEFGIVFEICSNKMLFITIGRDLATFKNLLEF